MAPLIVVILVLHSILYEKLSQIYNDSDNAHSFFPNYGERRKLDVHVAFIIFHFDWKSKRKYYHRTRSLQAIQSSFSVKSSSWVVNEALHTDRSNVEHIQVAFYCRSADEHLASTGVSLITLDRAVKRNQI